MTEAATHHLHELTQAFNFSDANKELFTRSMREMADFHMERSEVYRGICRQHGFLSDQIRSHEDVITIPHIFVTAFKERKLVSLPDDEIFMTFTSSGTQGQKSQINLDKVSFDRQAGMRTLLVRSLGLASEEKTNYLVFSYAPDIADQRGAAHTFNRYTSFAPSAEKYFALQQSGAGEPQFDLEQAISTLVRFAESSLPLRVVGFLAFSFVTLQPVRDYEVTLDGLRENLYLGFGAALAVLLALLWIGLSWGLRALRRLTAWAVWLVKFLMFCASSSTTKRKRTSVYSATSWRRRG